MKSADLRPGVVYATSRRRDPDYLNAVTPALLTDPTRRVLNNPDRWWSRDPAATPYVERCQREARLLVWRYYDSGGNNAVSTQYLRQYADKLTFDRALSGMRARPAGDDPDRFFVTETVIPAQIVGPWDEVVERLTRQGRERAEESIWQQARDAEVRAAWAAREAALTRAGITGTVTRPFASTPYLHLDAAAVDALLARLGS